MIQSLDGHLQSADQVHQGISVLCYIKFDISENAIYLSHYPTFRRFADYKDEL
jgi:hypothetical protein